MAPSLPDPIVPQDVYTEEYFRRGCMGAERWKATQGAALDPLHPGYAHVAGIAPGEVVVDWPADPRGAYEQAMHVNEMTVTSLRRALRQAGFADPEVWLGEWMYVDFVPEERAKLTYHRLAKRRLTARLGRGDLWARATV